ncbi:PD-(D/E)XK nuclease family transposase [Beggiatoa leptomitoformis]|uniref:PD-(D/E)XK nuclease family transposase n=1 Tax=Beggiatoa leptomitoformis TaxID=288004 RepID=UPI000706E152|nr:PD-(D/E)XK nuclease family transposase [Beggiatoa leptomitoformis]
MSKTNIKQVVPLRYGVIFKKAFCDVEIFNSFVHDILGIDFHCEIVETEKEFDTIIGNVKPRFDLYAEDKKKRIIVDIQHRRDHDHYDRFLHYHCAALLEQIKNSYDYRPNLAVYTIVVLTSGDKHKSPLSVIDFDPKNWRGEPLGEIPHKIVYLCPKYLNDDTPTLYREWLQVIDDSLDGEIDESQYDRPEIQKIVHRIEKDDISPEERYWMIEEYNDEKAKREMREQAVKEGMEKGIEKGIEKGMEKGLMQGRTSTQTEIAKKLISLGLDTAAIEQATGLNAEEIQQLKN